MTFTMAAISVADSIDSYYNLYCRQYYNYYYYYVQSRPLAGGLRACGPNRTIFGLGSGEFRANFK